MAKNSTGYPVHNYEGAEKIARDISEALRGAKRRPSMEKVRNCKRYRCFHHRNGRCARFDIVLDSEGKCQDYYEFREED